MLKLKYLVMIIFVLALLKEAPAQVLWRHTTSDAWINPDTNEPDSVICFTALGCNGDNCTAIGKLDNRKSLRMIINRSNDGGKSWFEQPHDLSYPPSVANSMVKKIQQIDSLNVIAMAHEYGAVFRTTDGGNTWFNIDCPVKKDLIDIHFSDPTTGILLCANNDSNIFTTSDGGEHWVHRPFQPMYACHSFGEGKYAVMKYAYGPIYITNDNFSTFDSTSMFVDTLADSLYYRYIFAYMKWGDDGTIFISGNHFTVDSSNGQYVAQGLIMRSTDSGNSWEQPWMFPLSKLQYIRHITRMDRDTIFAAGGNLGHYVFSLDRGKTWQLDSCLADTAYDMYKCYGIAMTSDGHPIASFGWPGLPYTSILFRGEFTAAKVEFSDIAKYYTQLYPNPTSGILHIETQFTLPITVVDIFGREVSKGAQLPRDGKVTVDLSYMPPGIYTVLFEWMGRRVSAGRVALIH